MHNSINVSVKLQTKYYEFYSKMHQDLASRKNMDD